MNKTMFSLFILLIALTWIPSASAEQTINNCPVPDDLKVIAPRVPQKLVRSSS
jgi:hypothetical protein